MKLVYSSLGVTYSWTEKKDTLSVATASKSITPSSGKLSVTVKSDANLGVYTVGVLQFTLTNNYESDAILSFDWNITKTYGTFSVDGDSSKTGSFSKKLSGHESVIITIESAHSNGGRKTGAEWTLPTSNWLRMSNR